MYILKFTLVNYRPTFLPVLTKIFLYPVQLLLVSRRLEPSVARGLLVVPLLSANRIMLRIMAPLVPAQVQDGSGAGVRFVSGHCPQQFWVKLGRGSGGGAVR